MFVSIMLPACLPKRVKKLKSTTNIIRYSLNQWCNRKLTHHKRAWLGRNIIQLQCSVVSSQLTMNYVMENWSLFLNTDHRGRQILQTPFQKSRVKSGVFNLCSLCAGSRKTLHWSYWTHQKMPNGARGASFVHQLNENIELISKQLRCRDSTVTQRLTLMSHVLNNSYAPVLCSPNFKLYNWSEVTQPKKHKKNGNIWISSRFNTELTNTSPRVLGTWNFFSSAATADRENKIFQFTRKNLLNSGHYIFAGTRKDGSKNFASCKIKFSANRCSQQWLPELSGFVLFAFLVQYSVWMTLVNK